MEINENLNLVFKGKNYSFTFPKVGEYRSIEVLRQNLSLNTYSGLARAMLASSEEALTMIDIEAYLSILCPELIEYLKCDSFSELGLLDYKELRSLFKEEFIPWWNEIEKLLRPEPIKKVKSDEETDQG